MSTKYSVAIIGLGQIGMLYDIDNEASANILSHAKAFQMHSHFNIVCGVDSNESARNLFKKHYKLRAFEKLEESLEFYRPQVVVISTPTKTHLSILNKLLSIYTPSAILCEKPLHIKLMMQDYD